MEIDTKFDAETATKRQKLKRNVDSSILNRFWELVDASDEKRSRAAEHLLTALLLKQPPVKFLQVIIAKVYKGKERKSNYIAPFILRIVSKRADMDSTFTCKLHHVCVSFVSVHQMAPSIT